MTDTTPRAAEQAVTHALRRTNSTQVSNMKLPNGWEFRPQWQDGLDYIVGADGRVKAVLPPTVLPDIAAVLAAAALEVKKCDAPAAETDAMSSGAPTATPRRPMVDSSDFEVVRSPQSGDDRLWRYARAMADADDEDMYEWMREYGRRARAAMKVADAEIAGTLARALPPAAGVLVGLMRAYLDALDKWEGLYKAWDRRTRSFELGAAHDAMTQARAALEQALASGAQAGAAGDRPGAAPVDISSDAFAYHDDVTPEGIAAIRARAGELRPARDWRVVEGVAPAGGLPGVEEIERLLSVRSLQGPMAYFSVVQHPFNHPPCLVDVVTAIADQAVVDFDGPDVHRTKWFASDAEIERWLRFTLEARVQNVLTAWNTPREGDAGAFAFVSRYGGPPPERDFIDIDALLRNVAMMAWREAAGYQREVRTAR